MITPEDWLKDEINELKKEIEQLNLLLDATAADSEIKDAEIERLKEIYDIAHKTDKKVIERLKEHIASALEYIEKHRNRWNSVTHREEFLKLLRGEES